MRNGGGGASNLEAPQFLFYIAKSRKHDIVMLAAFHITFYNLL